MKRLQRRLCGLDFFRSWLNPASSKYVRKWCWEKKRQSWRQDGDVLLPSLAHLLAPVLPSVPLWFLVHRAVPDPTAQHHAEDHLKDLTEGAQMSTRAHQYFILEIFPPLLFNWPTSYLVLIHYFLILFNKRTASVLLLTPTRLIDCYQRYNSHNNQQKHTTFLGIDLNRNDERIYLKLKCNIVLLFSDVESSGWVFDACVCQVIKLWLSCFNLMKCIL